MRGTLQFAYTAPFALKKRTHGTVYVKKVLLYPYLALRRRRHGPPGSIHYKILDRLNFSPAALRFLRDFADKAPVLQAGIIARCKIERIQFHEWIPGAYRDRRKIVKSLEKSHR